MSAFARVLIERFRCPESFLNLTPKGQLSEDEGFFQFSGTVCYGRSSAGRRRARIGPALYDVAKDIILHESEVCLPFDPTEIIENLRLERYPGTQDSWSRTRLRELYYSLRPIIPLAVRKYIQKFQLNGWKDVRFPGWPVDRSVENICERLLLLSLQATGADRIPFIWFWPGGARGCVLMTHDVETEQGRDCCAQLMDIDDLFGIKASFTIVPEERYSVSQQFLESIRGRGFEINVQDLNHDGRLFNDREQFLKRAERINEHSKAWGSNGFRAAVLYRKPAWYDAFEFSFDMSIPNTARLDPQRGGCCTVMPYFVGKILELPVTTTQDYMLFHLLGEHPLQVWRQQTQLVLEKNGMVSFIVHPDYVMHEDFVPIYKDLLIYLRELQNAGEVWMALPSDIDCWWRQRSNMQLVRRRGEWQIEGDGAERATVAYATNVGGKLIYQVERGSASGQVNSSSLQNTWKV